MSQELQIANDTKPTGGQQCIVGPWSVDKTYRRDPQVVWPENNCTEGNNEVVIGNENYLLSAMAICCQRKRTSHRPDLRYFNQPRK